MNLQISLKTISESSTSIRYPDGMVINPQAADIGQPPTIRELEYVVLMTAEKVLMLMFYSVIHQAHTSYYVNTVTVTREYITSFPPLRDQELTYMNPDPEKKTLKNTIMSKWIDFLDNYLRKYRGAKTLPRLRYAQTYNGSARCR